MKKLFVSFVCMSLLFILNAYSEDGSRLWLRFDSQGGATVTKSANAMGYTAAIAEEELQNNWSGSPIYLELNEQLTELKDGYKIATAGSQITITASREIGLLYGSYHLLRLQQTDCDLSNLNIEEIPFYNYRMLNHWDNLNGTIERGYAGKSIWTWSDLPGKIADRYKMYARANASVGINATVLNNVNASSNILKQEYLDKVKVLADEFRPYGIKVYLSLNFAAPKAIGGLATADPLDAGVVAWWQNKIEEIYAAIPDFGGFLVKANSEGQPGPQDYERTHADGANMLAGILKDYGGIVVWRAFVYGNTNAERASQAYLEFKPLDGEFADNVVVQIKNGPMDFQPKEPFSPLFGAMGETKLGIEFQITQEYLGASNHLVYLAPMWKDCLDRDTYQYGQGSSVLKKVSGSSLIAGVSNIGEDANWCGHDFAQANWYAFGRLAWNPHLSSEEIAKEWIGQTFSTDQTFIKTVSDVMLDSWIAAVNYMTPFGLSFLASTGHHYGPLPWSRTNFHKADSKTLGFLRDVAVRQYNEPLASTYANIETCPEEYLLWFHPVSWDHKMRNGKTMWENLCHKYEEGVVQASGFSDTWAKLKEYVDSERFNAIHTKLKLQAEEAIWWKDACLLHFQTLHKKNFPTDISQPVYDLDYLKTVKFSAYNTFGCPTVQEIYDNVVSKKKEITQDVDYSHLIINNDFDLAPDPVDCTGSIAVTAGIDGWVDDMWRVSESTCKQLYGWENNHPDHDFGNNARGIDGAASSKSGDWAFLFSGNSVLPDFYEFYQVIDKDDLPAGTYKLQCGMAVQHTKMTNQRLFANNKVQYHGKESQYVSNLTEREHNTFAGHSSGDKTLKEMLVYVTIGENDSLKIGIRTGNKLNNGSIAPTDNPMRGWFRADNFRLTKLDPDSEECLALTDAKLVSLSVDFGTLKPAFDPNITEYTCRIPRGVSTVTPTAAVSSEAASVTIEDAVISSGSGIATVTVTAGDDFTTKTYTVTFIAEDDENYTHLIVNNDFELAPDANCEPVPVTSGMDGWNSGAWRPLESSCSARQPYGWIYDQSILGTSNSQGITSEGSNKHGNWAFWIGGSGGSSSEETNIELYQTISSSVLGAGTYKVQCLLAVGSVKKYNQRLFANGNVQYFGTEETYKENLVINGEEYYTFAGHLDYGEANLKEMKVYVTIGENDPLKIGVRTNNRSVDGNLRVQQSPMFRLDYFRLTKISKANAADAKLSSISLNAGNIDFHPDILIYEVTLPEGTESVIPIVVPSVLDAKVEGTDEVDVYSGSGRSVIKVTALNGVSTKTYIINYTVGTHSGIESVNAKVGYTVMDRKLTVTGVDAYSVFNLDGMKIADVATNKQSSTVDLHPGFYIVKTSNAGVFKIVVR